MRPLESIGDIRRRSGNRSKKRRVFIITEGVVTEINYFRSVKEHLRLTGADCLTEIVLMQRYSIQYGHSDPLRIIGLAKDYFNMLETRTYSEQLLVGRMVESVIRQKKLDDGERNELAKNLAIGLRSKGLSANGFIGDLDGAVAVCNGIIKDASNIGIRCRLYDDVGYDKSIDIVCIVVDRDSDSRSTEKYHQFLNACDECGYKPFVTNPMFELWLLFHFDIEGDIADLRNPVRCKSTMKRLLKKHGIYRKDVDCTELMCRIPHAISVSAEFCTIPESLEHDIGTNLPEMMRILNPECNMRR